MCASTSERQPSLKPGQWCSEAIVDSHSEGYVVVGVALDVKAVGLLEDFLVAVR
jgi:hypothetical protein